MNLKIGDKVEVNKKGVYDITDIGSRGTVKSIAELVTVNFYHITGDNTSNHRVFPIKIKDLTKIKTHKDLFGKEV